MASTSTPGAFPFPEDADATDVPADIQALADRLAAIADTVTTTERDALAGADLWTGRVVWNSTTSALEVYDGAAWAALGADLTAVADGSAAAPALAFADDTDTGLYRPAADKTAIAAGGKAVATFEGGTNHYLKLHAPAAGQDFILDWVDEGGDLWYRQYFDSSTSRFRMFAYNNGTSEGETYVSLTSGYGGVWRFPAGSAAQPALSFVSDTDTGFYLNGAGTVEAVAQGLTAAQFFAFSGVAQTGVPQGSASRPGLSFIGDNDTGIYRRGANDLAISAGNTFVATFQSTVIGIQTDVTPGADNTLDLGASGLRWANGYFFDVFTHDGGVHTSDASEKSDVQDTPLGLDFIRLLKPRRWRWNDGVRPHDGFIVQEVVQALADAGVDDAGMYVDPAVKAVKRGKPKKADYKPEPVERDDGESDDDYAARKQQAKDDADKAHAYAVEQWEAEKAAPKGLRYSEFIGPLVKAVQEQQTQIDAQQTQIDALTARLDALEAA